METEPSGENVRELDMHDRSIQSIYGVALQLETCLNLLNSSPEKAQVALDLAVSRLNGLIEELRHRIYELLSERRSEQEDSNG